MNNRSTGQTIRYLRKKASLTQKQLAEMINVSEKTVSKWETDNGLPDTGTIASLAKALQTTSDSILRGLSQHHAEKTKSVPGFYVCPVCNNVIISGSGSEIFCHGNRLEEIVPVDADEEHRLVIDTSDGETLITSSHPMDKDHYISFCALVSPGSADISYLYPEWDMNVRFPLKKGELIFYCTAHGLKSQKLK